MKKLAWFVMVVGMVVCLGTNLNAGNFPNPGAAPVIVTNPQSQPVPVTGTVRTPCCYHFVGYSTGLTDGNAGGIVGMNSRCQASFGPSARMCTTFEFLSSPVGTSGGNQSPWIQLYIVASFIETVGGQQQVVFVDFSGLQKFATQGDLTCNQWTANDGTTPGLSVSQATGVIAEAHCNVSRPVTCCAP
jgi:hypothetical protein